MVEAPAVGPSLSMTSLSPQVAHPWWQLPHPVVGLSLVPRAPLAFRLALVTLESLVSLERVVVPRGRGPGPGLGGRTGGGKDSRDYKQI